MGVLGLLALLSGVLMISSFGSDDDIVETDDSDAPDEPDERDEERDTGASFEQTDDGVTIEVGEDETRSVVAIHYVDTQDDEHDFIAIDEVRYYLADEETDWSGVNWENRGIVPGVEDHEEGLNSYYLSDFEESQGLELIGVVDVKGVPQTDDPDDRVGEVTSNVPIESYYLESETDGNELLYFLPEDYVVTINGEAEEQVSTSTVGDTGPNWIGAYADGIVVDGSEGNDTLTTGNDNVTLIGGLGDDDIWASGENLTLIGGEGDDDVRTSPTIITEGIPSPGSSFVDLGQGDDRASVHNSTVHGGQGNDYIDGISSEEDTLLYGEGGDDHVIASGMAAVAYGGAGNDFVAANNGATAYGGNGNDHIQLEAGTTAYGGAGDDRFTPIYSLRDEDGPATITTGDGADTIEIHVGNSYGGEPDNVYMTVTDFDPTEDVLQVSSFQTNNPVDDIEIIEADDGSYTDVRVTYTGSIGLEPGITVIRLEGTTELTADQIVIA